MKVKVWDPRWSICNPCIVSAINARPETEAKRSWLNECLYAFSWELSLEAKYGSRSLSHVNMLSCCLLSCYKPAWWTPFMLHSLKRTCTMPPDLFMNGTTKTTEAGYINPNHQRCCGHRGVPGTDHGQVAYRMECLVSNCGHIYGANGTDVFQRKCPSCQNGKVGIPF